MTTMQAQAPICPYCFDDHLSLRDCSVKELKKILLMEKFKLFERTCNDQKQDGSIPEKIKEMIQWL